MKKIPKQDYTPEFKERPSKGWVRHFDRGGQYLRDCQKLLQQFGMVVSMPQREATHLCGKPHVNCWDNGVSVKANARSALYRNYNAPMESAVHLD